MSPYVVQKAGHAPVSKNDAFQKRAVKRKRIIGNNSKKKRKEVKGTMFM